MNLAPHHPIPVDARCTVRVDRPDRRPGDPLTVALPATVLAVEQGREPWHLMYEVITDTGRRIRAHHTQIREAA